MYVYIGILGHAAAGEGGAGNVAFLAAGLVATAVTAFLVTRKARAKLKEAGAD
jgi:hypothetical protein